MKKQLLLGALLIGSTLALKAQVLQTDNFTGFTAGNLSQNFDGSVPGQGGYYLLSSDGEAPTTSTNAGVSNAMVDTFGNPSLIVTGPNGDKGTRFLWKDGLPAAWAARTSGNNIIELEFDINPGGPSTSRNVFGIYIYNADFTRVLAGATVRSATKELVLVAYSTPTGNPVNNYSYTLVTGGLILPSSTWSRVGVSYNKANGQVRIQAPGIAEGGLALTGSSPNTDPAEVNIISFSGHTTAAPNTEAGTMSFDNIVVRASATGTLLGNEEITSSVSQFSVFPNPAADIINIKNSDGALANKVNISDLNGRTVKTVLLDNVSDAQVDISDLSSGVYMLTVTSDKGSFVKKIVKS